MCRELSAELADASIHVLLSVDETHLLGLVGVVSSVLRHAREPGRLQFHVVVAQREEKAVEGFLRCFGLASGHQVVVGWEARLKSGSVPVVSLPPPQVTLVPLEVGQLEAWLGAEPRVYSRQEEVGNLASSANFARFLFPRLFSSLTRAIYLDADTVVQSDITPFWEQLMASDRLLLAAPRSVTVSYPGLQPRSLYSAGLGLRPTVWFALKLSAENLLHMACSVGK